MFKGQGSLDNINKGQIKNLEERVNLPDVKEEKNKLVLMVVDPHHLFAYFSFNEETKAKLGSGEIGGVFELHDNHGIYTRDTITFEACKDNTKKYHFLGLASDTKYHVILNIPKISLSLKSDYITTPRNFKSNDLSYTEAEYKF